MTPTLSAADVLTDALADWHDEPVSFIHSEVCVALVVALRASAGPDEIVCLLPDGTLSVAAAYGTDGTPENVPLYHIKAAQA